MITDCLNIQSIALIMAWKEGTYVSDFLLHWSLDLKKITVQSNDAVCDNSVIALTLKSPHCFLTLFLSAGKFNHKPLTPAYSLDCFPNDPIEWSLRNPNESINVQVQSTSEPAKSAEQTNLWNDDSSPETHHKLIHLKVSTNVTKQFVERPRWHMKVTMKFFRSSVVLFDIVSPVQALFRDRRSPLTK